MAKSKQTQYKIVVLDRDDFKTEIGEEIFQGLIDDFKLPSDSDSITLKVALFEEKEKSDG